MLAEQTPADFIAFDMLALGDEELMDTALRSAAGRCSAGAGRRRAADAPDPDHDRRRRWPGSWFEMFEGAGLDGLIAKPADDRRTTRASA